MSLEPVLSQALRQVGARRGFGYQVELQTRTTRLYGVQSLPVRIVIADPEDLLRLTGKLTEFARLQADVALIRAALPQLEGWLEANLGRVVEHHGAWPGLLAVCGFLLANPRPGLYARELPVAVHTKFIEEHAGILRRLLDALLPPEAIDRSMSQFELRYGLRYDEPLVRLRLLDPAIGPELGLPLSDISAPASQLAALPLGKRTCVIVENKLVFLTLPMLPNALTLFGSGFGVERLAELGWLHSCRIWYWGDLDAQGFQILARLRARLPQVRSVLMDAATFAAFEAFVVPGTPCASTELETLTPAEQALFDRLASSTLRLEQERISYAYACEQLNAALLGAGRAQAE